MWPELLLSTIIVVTKLLDDLVNVVIAAVEILLILRFVLKLLGANPSAELVSWIYSVTQPLVNPFVTVFPNPALRGPYELEFTTLFAIFVYAFVGFLAQEVVRRIGKG